jgi:hypothetical protein
VRPDFVADKKPPSVISCPPLLAFTVKLTGVVSVSPPPVPVTVTEDPPRAAVPLAVNVSVEVPDPPEMLDGLNAAVTPDGKPVAERETALLNPPEGVLVMVEVPVLPWITVTVEGDAESEKLGVVPLVIVSEKDVVSMTPPPMPVTVTGTVPTVAVLLAVKVKVEVPCPPEILAGLKLAVTPVGKPLADRATALLNPPEALLVIVDVPDFPS